MRLVPSAPLWLTAAYRAPQPSVVKLLAGLSIERVRQRTLDQFPALAPAVSLDGNADSTLFDPVQQQAGIAVDLLDVARASKMGRPSAAA
jgi:hypothetical protein